MDRQLVTRLLFEGVLAHQNDPAAPIGAASMKLGEEIGNILTPDQCFKVLEQFGGNRQGMALWLTGFVTAIAILERDERI